MGTQGGSTSTEEATTQEATTEGATTQGGSTTTEEATTQVCEDEAGNFCTKNKNKCNKENVQERCPVTCDLCPEEPTTNAPSPSTSQRTTIEEATTQGGSTTTEEATTQVCEDEA